MDEELTKEQQKIIEDMNKKAFHYDRLKALFQIFALVFISITFIILLLGFIIPHDRNQGLFGWWIFFGPIEGAIVLSIVFGVIASIYYRKALSLLADIRVQKEQFKLDNKENKYL